MDTSLPARILLLSDRQSYAEQLLSQLRSEGLQLRVSAVEAMTDLTARLEEQPWDILLLFCNATLPAGKAILDIKRNNTGLPILCICRDLPAGEQALSLLQAGISTFVREDDKAAIRFHIRRELQAYQQVKQTRELQVQVRELDRRLQDFLENSSQPFAYVLEGMHLYCNPAYVRFFGHQDAAALQKTPVLDLFRGADRKALRILLADKSESKHVLQGSLRVQDERPLQVSLSPCRFKGEDCLQLSIEAAAGNPQYRQELSGLQDQDLLTRLYTLDFFRGKLEAAIAAAVRHGKVSALIVIQLNELLDVRSSLGQSNTNQVLREVADFLRENLQKAYAGARLDTHEFAVLLEDCKIPEAVDLGSFIKNRINNHISPPSLPSLHLSCSIGIASVNEHARDADELIARARNSMDLPSHPEKNHDFRIGDSLDYDMDEMLTYLERALQEGHFRLLYQPIVNIRGERGRHFEVLSRLLDSDGNDIRPDLFLPLLNLNGQAEDFDRLVFDMALSRFAEQGDNDKQLFFHLTSSSIFGRTFLPWLTECLHRHAVPAQKLILQLNEIDIFNSPEHALRFAADARQLDLGLAVCRFGCAIDPFRYMETLSASHIKLDSSLIRDIIYSQQQQARVTKLLKRAHVRKLGIIAPGLEDAELLPLLWKMGVDYVQGHYLKRPAQAMDYPFIEETEITLQAHPEKDK